MAGSLQDVRQGFRRVPRSALAVIVASCATALGPLSPEVSAAPLPVRSAQYPANLQFGSITAGPGGVELVGTTAVAGDSGVDCLSAQLSPSTLALSDIVEPRCDNPLLSGQAFMAVSQPLPGGLSDDIRLAALAPFTGALELGPVIGRYEDVSDTHLESTVGGGSLWLYLAAPLGLPNHSEAIEVSEATGQVVAKAVFPWVLTRPAIAADDEGLYVSPSNESGFSRAGANSNVAIFRVAPASGHVQAFYRAGAQGGGEGVFTNWMTADGSSIWAQTCRHVTHANVCRVLRFDGTGSRPAMTSGQQSQTDDWVVGNGTVGLFSSLLPKAATVSQALTPTTVVKFDPWTGSQAKVTSVMLPPYWGSFSYGGNQQTAIYDGALYLLVPPGQIESGPGEVGTEPSPGVVYRVPIREAP